MKYDALTPLSEKRHEREASKALAKQADALHAFNERARQNKRTVIYGPSDAAKLAREFCKENDLHIDGVITNPARLLELLSTHSDQIDNLLMVHPIHLTLGDFMKILFASRAACVGVIALGQINALRRLLFSALS